MTTEAAADRLSKLRERLAEPPEVTVAVEGGELRLRSRHGLFSARGLDEGTGLLLEELAGVRPQGRVLDLGCGYGALGLVLARRWPDARVVLVDADVRAVGAAAENVLHTGAEQASVVLSDGVQALDPNECFDLVVANLPAQAGNEALDQLLLDAYDVLDEGGALVVVAVNGLRRYLLRRLQFIFGNGRKVRQGARHTVLEAAKLSS